jgi:hypothetical protein
MPYPFAHPAAILPLIGPMGRFAVPSALVIGCMVPDAWYFVPLLTREDSHSLGGLLWFCVPAGLLAYFAFHLLLKQPLLALLPERLAAKLAAFAFPTLPEARCHAVLVSLLVGAFTHLAWDALTHDKYVVNGFQVMQHASTLLGTAWLAGWLWRRLGGAPSRALPPGLRLSPAMRGGILAALAFAGCAWGAWEISHAAMPLSFDPTELRRAMRAAGLAGAQALGLSTIGYAIVWKLLR